MQSYKKHTKKSRKCLVKWERMSIFAHRTSNQKNMDKSNNQELCDVKNLIAEHFSSKALEAMPYKKLNPEV